MATLANASGWRGSITRFLQRSYAADYFGLSLVLALFILLEIFVEPFHRMFSLDDRSKSYPHALVQRVSELQNVLYAGVGPLSVILLWALISRTSFHKGHVTTLGLLISLFLTSLLTDIVKNAVGRPRPDLIARCKPRLGTPAHELVTINVCTETSHHTLQDGWRSFPSGHSSWAFSGLGYLALFLAGQMHVFRPGADLARVLISLTPLVGAALIAMSRLADYRHDVYDVSAGSLLGMVVAYSSYRRYYRGLRHSRCDEPYPNEAYLSGRRNDIETRGQEFELTDIGDEDEDEDDRSEALPLHRDTLSDRS